MFDLILIDELIDIRRQAREEKDWKLSDEIRDYLDTKFVFIFDHKEGQEVYHRTRGTREDIVKEIQKDKKLEKDFNSWLYSIQSSIKI